MEPGTTSAVPERMLETSADFLLRGVSLIEGIVTSNEVPFSSLYPSSPCLSFLHKLSQIPSPQPRAKSQTQVNTKSRNPS